MSSFLSLPVELRLVIYQLFLSELQHISADQQPRNLHFRILHVCKQIAFEAGELASFRSYVSLGIHEAQISAFNANISIEAASLIKMADVANDSRLVHAAGHSVPASGLHAALARLVSLRNLRVFECNRSRPITDFVLGARFTLQFEKAMFPSFGGPHLDSYELYLPPFKSSVRIFQVISSNSIQNLRISGDCGIPQGTKLPRLTTLTINGVTGHYLDQHLEEYFAHSCLKTLQYKQGSERSGARFELRDHHLKSLAFGIASGMHKLVLLGCSHLSTLTLALCLRNLEQLRYLAISFVSVHELDSDFVIAFPSSLMVIKLAVTNVWYTKPRLREEHSICEAVEDLIILRKPSLRTVCVYLRDEIMTLDRRTRWTSVAEERRFVLQLGPWDEDEIF